MQTKPGNHERFPDSLLIRAVRRVHFRFRLNRFVQEWNVFHCSFRRGSRRRVSSSPYSSVRAVAVAVAVSTARGPRLSSSPKPCSSLLFATLTFLGCWCPAAAPKPDAVAVVAYDVDAILRRVFFPRALRNQKIFLVCLLRVRRFRRSTYILAKGIFRAQRRSHGCLCVLSQEEKNKF